MVSKPIAPEALTSATREELEASLSSYASMLPMNQLRALVQSAGETAGAFTGQFPI